MYFMSFDNALILDFASLTLFFFKGSYQSEAYPFILSMANLNAFSSLYTLSLKIILMTCLQLRQFFFWGFFTF